MADVQFDFFGIVADFLDRLARELRFERMGHDKSFAHARGESVDRVELAVGVGGEKFFARGGDVGVGRGQPRRKAEVENVLARGKVRLEERFRRVHVHATRRNFTALAHRLVESRKIGRLALFVAEVFLAVQHISERQYVKIVLCNQFVRKVSRRIGDNNVIGIVFHNSNS